VAIYVPRSIAYRPPIVQRLCLVLLLLLVTACSGGPEWANRSLPPGQEPIDERACRQSAGADMDEPQNYTAPGSEKYDTPMQMVDRSERRAQFDSLVANCMELKGYRRTGNQ